MSGSEKDSFRSFREWARLETIVANAGLITSDRLENPPKRKSPFGGVYGEGGLLGNPSVGGVTSNEKEVRISALAHRLKGNRLLDNWSIPWHIIKILPGADSLGDNREQRVLALKAKLHELPAYQHLANCAAYSTILSTLKGSKAAWLRSDLELDEQLPVNVRSALLEFRVLKFSSLPIGFFLYSEKETRKGPSGRDLRTLKSTIGHLHQNLKTMDIPFELGTLWDLQSATRKTLEEFCGLPSNYRPPRVDSATKGRQLVRRLCEGMKKEFDRANVDFITNLCAVVEFEPDRKLVLESVKTWGRN